MRHNDYLRDLKAARPKPFDPVETILGVVCALSGFILVCGVVLVMFLAAMAYASKVRAADISTEQQIRRDCRFDALRHCPAESLDCLKRETPECRSAVIACMLANIDKLQPKCRQHFY